MAFDLDPQGNEVSEIRSQYQSRHVSPYELLEATEYITDEYLDDSIAIIGNISTIAGAYSTKTRRPLSPSIDLVFQDQNLEKLGSDYPSWTFSESYFADFSYPENTEESKNDHLEVALIDIEKFPLFNFDENIINNRRVQTIETEKPNSGELLEYEIPLAEPEQSIASKFNRLNQISNKKSDIIKGSDSIDMASHLHWGQITEELDFKYLSELIEEKVERPYTNSFDSIRNSKQNFSKDEKPTLDKSLNKLSELLGEQD